MSFLSSGHSGVAALQGLKCGRFRPNIILSGGSPFVEDQWEEIVINSEREDSGVEGMKISVVSKCARCLVSLSVLSLAKRR